MSAPISTTSASDGTNSPRITIDAAGDIVLRAYCPSEYHKFISDDGVTTKKGEVLASFRVSKQVLIASSKYFEVQFSANWSKTGQRLFDIGEEHIEALEVWLRVLHESLVDKSFAVGIPDVWSAIQLGRKYDWCVMRLTPWFQRWLSTKGGSIANLEKFDTEDLRKLLFPCHELENIQGFATVTRRLVYEFAGHITENNPTKYRDMRLRNVVIGALNAARGSLRTEIHKKVYKNKEFLLASCACKESGLFAFELALMETGVWPMEDYITRPEKKSIRDILRGLKGIKYSAPTMDCRLCSKDHGQEVVGSVLSVQRHFDGLCLDCLDEDQIRDWDADYENHAERSSYTRYDGACRIKHGQPTWYFSWLGRREMENPYQKEKAMRKMLAASRRPGRDALRFFALR